MQRVNGFNSDISLFFPSQPGTDGLDCKFTKRVLKAITKERLAEALISGPKLCLDLSMTDSMSDKVEASRPFPKEAPHN